MPNLIVFAGLPGTGKSSVARRVAQATGALWLRIDSIEQALREFGAVQDFPGDAGYRIAYALAEDNLRLGHDVVGDSVNPWMLTRNAWQEVGKRAGAEVVEVETVCSDKVEHRRRVEARESDVAGLSLPSWQAVQERDYHPWDRDHLTIDTSDLDLDSSVGAVLAVLKQSAKSPAR